MEWYRKRTLGGVLDETAARHGQREALVFGDQRLTYADLKAETDRLAKGLMAIGVQPGERVAVWMTNRPEWLFLMFAVARVGACLVPLNTRYRSDDVAYTVQQSRAETWIALERAGPVDFQQLLLDSMAGVAAGQDGGVVAGNYPDLHRVVILGECRVPGGMDWAALLGAGEGVSDDELAARFAAVDPDGLMVLIYTSGTTGHPKGVMHSHVVIRNTHERCQLLGYTAQDVHLNYLPMFHIYAFSEIAMACALTGAKQVMTETFDADEALDLAQAEGATILHGFEAHWLALLEARAHQPRDLQVRLGTLPSGVESTLPVAERVQDVFCPTVSGFGMSETWAYVACSNPGHTREQRVAASGYPMNDYQFRVIDPESGQEQPVGVPGELLVKGYAVTSGYWDKPEATAAAFDEAGWFHTGDMASLRADGHLVFMGRYKDMLKVGGENVSPAEVERRLREMDEVLDAAVVGYPDERLGEVAVAFVILHQGRHLSLEQMAERLHGRIASFKIPRALLAVESFPMTSSGKIRKVALRQLARERLAEAPREAPAS